MIKRNNIFILVLILIVFIGGALMAVIKNNFPDIKTFKVGDYQYYIENFSSEENIGSISDTKDLLIKVEEIWIKKYGERIKKEKPYQLFYDEENKIWLIQGTLQANMMGGVANILVENDTGKILAVWHDK